MRKRRTKRTSAHKLRKLSFESLEDRRVLAGSETVFIDFEDGVGPTNINNSPYEFINIPNDHYEGITISNAVWLEGKTSEGDPLMSGHYIDGIYGLGVSKPDPFYGNTVDYETWGYPGPSSPIVISFDKPVSSVSIHATIDSQVGAHIDAFDAENNLVGTDSETGYIESLGYQQSGKAIISVSADAISRIELRQFAMVIQGSPTGWDNLVYTTATTEGTPQISVTALPYPQSGTTYYNSWNNNSIGPTDFNDYIGPYSSNDFYGETDHVISFPLPDINPDDLLSAKLIAKYRGTNPNYGLESLSYANQYKQYNYEVYGVYNLDLYGIGSMPANEQIRTSWHYTGPNDPTKTKLQDNFVTPYKPMYATTDETGSEAVLEFIKDQYAAGAEPGDLVVFRISPDKANQYEFGSQMGYETPGTLEQPLPHEGFILEFTTPTEWDEMAEILSKDIAYRTLVDESEIALSNFGYENAVPRKVKVFKHPNGFLAYGLTSDTEDPILVVRGSDDGPDVYANFDADGVGAKQYATMRTEIEAWIETVTAGDKRLSITGHSLGGALAQLIAAGATENGYQFEHVTTFNSPGISQTEVDKFVPANAKEVRHYITNGDLVSMAGEEFLPGDWRRATFSGLSLPDKHSLPVLVDELMDLNGNPELFKKDVQFENFATTTNLSADFYYHTDTAYWGWLFAAQAATTVEPLTALAAIPSQLLFRKTTEDIREELGTAWRGIETAVASNFTPLDCDDPNSSLMFPDIEVGISDYISIQATGLDISCEAGDSTSLIMHGQVTIPELFNATADFTGENNYLELTSEGKFNIKGDLTAEDIPLGIDYLKLKEVGLHIDTVNKIWVASGALEIVPWEVTVGGSLGFHQGNWNLVSAEIDGINKPIGPILPTAFLQALSGKVEHFAPSDMEPVDFTAGVVITAGPTYSLNLPSWAGGPISTQLAEIDLMASINEDRFKGKGEVEFLSGLATVDGEIEWNWEKDYLIGKGEVDLLDGLITGSASFRANNNLDITMSSTATLNFPDMDSMFSGTTGLSGNFAFKLINDNTKANDYIAAWTTFSYFGILRDFGYRLYFDGRLVDIGSVPLPVTAPEGPLEGEFLSSDYTVPADTEWALFAASWDGDGAGGEIVLSTPSGVLITEAEIALRSDMAIVSEFSDSNRRVVLVTSPEAGNWSVSVNDATGLGNITYLSSVANTSPIIDLLQATGGLNDAPVQIDYSALDPDSDASISFYYDTTGSGFDGIEIIGNILESDASSSLNWDTVGVPNGLYYIYAVIDDGINAPVSVYLGSPIQVSSNGFEFTINAEIGDTQVGDTVDSLPASQSTLHEWETVTIDLWGQVPSIPDGAIDGVDFTMQFNSLYYADPVVVDSVGSASLVVSDVSGDIRKVRVTLSAVDVSELTAGDIFLVTQLQFAPSLDAGHGVPSQDVGDYFTVVNDLGFHLSEVAYAIDNLTSLVETISHTAATELVPVVYDIDNNGSVGLTDLARLVNVFGKTVDIGIPFSFAADFDQNGVIGLSDLSRLVNHFGLEQGTNTPIVLPVIDSGQTETSVPLEAEPIYVASAVPNFFQESIAHPTRRMKLTNIHAEEEMIDQIYEFENRLDHDDWKLWLSEEESMITFLAEEQSRIDFELEESLLGAL
ncbi:MAG: hypothetical protein COA78_20740 [Blastopirellula sp.]|nr:MAG: hypothetical protein COA78_20740 [Blastopirellula sp.]